MKVLAIDEFIKSIEIFESEYKLLSDIILLNTKTNNKLIIPLISIVNDVNTETDNKLIMPLISIVNDVNITIEKPKKKLNLIDLPDDILKHIRKFTFNDNTLNNIFLPLMDNKFTIISGGLTDPYNNYILKKLFGEFPREIFNNCDTSYYNMLLEIEEGKRTKELMRMENDNYDNNDNNNNNDNNKINCIFKNIHIRSIDNDIYHLNRKYNIFKEYFIDDFDTSIINVGSVIYDTGEYDMYIHIQFLKDEYIKSEDYNPHLRREQQRISYKNEYNFYIDKYGNVYNEFNYNKFDYDNLINSIKYKYLYNILQKIKLQIYNF
jgi:hypothetical protein